MKYEIVNCRHTHYPADILAKTALPVEKIDDNIRQLVQGLDFLKVIIGFRGLRLTYLLFDYRIL